MFKDRRSLTTLQWVVQRNILTKHTYRFLEGCFNSNACSLDTSAESLLGSNSTKRIFTFFAHTHCGENSSNRSMLIRFKRLRENTAILNTRTEIRNPNEKSKWELRNPNVSMLSVKNKKPPQQRKHWSILSVSKRNHASFKIKVPKASFLKLEANKINIFLKLTCSFVFYCKTETKRSGTFSTDSASNSELIEKLAFRRLQIRAKNSLLPSEWKM